MTRLQPKGKAKWEPWHEERERFKARATEGFRQDLRALYEHILKLQQICPKDKAAWPELDSQNHISNLKVDYRRFQKYLRDNTPLPPGT